MGGTPIRDGVASKAEIQAALQASLGAVAAWFEAQADADFEIGPEGRWSAGQHLDHLVRSVKPISLGLVMPKFVVGLVFGASRRPGISFGELAARYEAVLDDGGKAGGRFVPPAVARGRKPALLAQLRSECAKLVRRVHRWSEADLDRYAATHPLLGRLSLRELLFFTIYHHDHHLHTLRRDYAAGA